MLYCDDTLSSRRITYVLSPLPEVAVRLHAGTPTPLLQQSQRRSVTPTDCWYSPTDFFVATTTPRRTQAEPPGHELAPQELLRRTNDRQTTTTTTTKMTVINTTMEWIGPRWCPAPTATHTQHQTKWRTANHRQDTTALPPSTTRTTPTTTTNGTMRKTKTT